MTTSDWIALTGIIISLVLAVFTLYSRQAAANREENLKLRFSALQDLVGAKETAYTLRFQIVEKDVTRLENELGRLRNDQTTANNQDTKTSIEMTKLQAAVENLSQNVAALGRRLSGVTRAVNEGERNSRPGLER